MGCTSSRHKESKLLAILDKIVFTVVCEDGEDDIASEMQLLAALQHIALTVKKKATCHPVLLHQFNHTMIIIKKHRPQAFVELRPKILETLLLITARCPCPQDLVMNDSHYLNENLKMQLSIVIPKSPRRGVIENASSRSTPCSSPRSSKTAPVPVLTMPPMPPKFPISMEELRPTPATSSDSVPSSPGKFRSFYVNAECGSQETLGDFGFFEEEGQA